MQSEGMVNRAFRSFKGAKSESRIIREMSCLISVQKATEEETRIFFLAVNIAKMQLEAGCVLFSYRGLKRNVIDKTSPLFTYHSTIYIQKYVSLLQTSTFKRKSKI